MPDWLIEDPRLPSSPVNKGVKSKSALTSPGAGAQEKRYKLAVCKTEKEECFEDQYLLIAPITSFPNLDPLLHCFRNILLSIWHSPVQTLFLDTMIRIYLIGHIFLHNWWQCYDFSSFALLFLVWICWGGFSNAAVARIQISWKYSGALCVRPDCAGTSWIDTQLWDKAK